MKLLVISDCRFRGKHTEKGSELEINEAATQDKNDASQLIHAGRAVPDSPENRKLLAAELATERKQKAATPVK